MTEHIIDEVGKIRLVEQTLTDSSSVFQIQVRVETYSGQKEWATLFSPISETRAMDAWHHMVQAQHTEFA